jgi:hypothetical protein
MSEDFRPSTQVLDRNKAILQTRNLLEIPNWVIFSSQVTTFSSARDCASELVSVAIYSPEHKVLLDSCVRPAGTVTTEMLRQHGTNPSRLMQSMTVDQLFDRIKQICGKKQVLCWDLPLQVRNLSLIASLAGLPSPGLHALSIQMCYAHFVGEELSPGNYKLQALPGGSCADEESILPLTECENMINLISLVARSSQISDSAVFNKKWSAAFYKPKLGAAQKIKSFFGIGE